MRDATLTPRRCHTPAIDTFDRSIGITICAECDRRTGNAQTITGPHGVLVPLCSQCASAAIETLRMHAIVDRWMRNLTGLSPELLRGTPS